MSKLGDFLKGVGASNELIVNAWKNGSFIECVCLESNQIDALLRIGLILQDQLNNRNSDAEEKYLFQGETDKKISEKQIYELAKQNGVIDEMIRTHLISIYEERNKVIHRYIISEITTKRVLEIALEYNELKERNKEIIKKLEDHQIESGIGMTKKGDKKLKSEVSEMISKMSKEKHGLI